MIFSNFMERSCNPSSWKRGTYASNMIYNINKSWSDNKQGSQMGALEAANQGDQNRLLKALYVFKHKT